MNIQFFFNITAGLHNVIENGYFDVSFDVFPSVWYNSGAMFSLGTPDDFSYYINSKNQPQYLSLAFEYKSVSLSNIH